jgi:hypothetical protein
MHLGQIIARFQDPDFAAEILLSLDDLPLAARVSDAAARNDLTPGEFAFRSVARFVDGASDEEWLALVGHMTQSSDPAEAFLRRILSGACSHEESAGSSPSASAGRPG